MRADRFAGIASVIAGLGVAAASADIDILATQPTLSARFVPYLLATVLVAGGVILAVRPADRPLSDVVGALFAWRGLAFAAVFLAYTLTFRFIDFRLGTWLFVLAAMWIVGARKWVELTVVPPAVSLTIYVLFRHGFSVLLPTWT
jgi:putative tricarboxylic transport membrane protein